MGWLELLIVCLIPGSIKVTREFGKMDLTIIPASFLLIEFLCKKAQGIFAKSEEKAETKAAI